MVGHNGTICGTVSITFENVGLTRTVMGGAIASEIPKPGSFELPGFGA
jgi:hypothetical protein